MAIIVEYLSIFQRTDSFCNSAASFIRLLQVDSDISVAERGISLQGEHACSFQLSDGNVAGKKQHYFHLSFTWEGDPDTAQESLERFLSLLKKVRATVAQAGGVVETLWDEVSSHYAEKAYPLIHEIENLMRRLIANFMLVRVGCEWAQETLPKTVDYVVKSSKRKNKDYVNVLHTVDFSDLGNFLFEPYSKRTDQELFAKIRDVKTVEEVKTLQEFVPESNWKRYFAKLVDCEDGYLKTRWEKLYDLRCKVAHNVLMTADDLNQIGKLIGEVKPKLQEAIAKLSKVTVPRDEVASVAESAARTVNTVVGEFITCWQQLEAEIFRHMETSGKDIRIIPSPRELVRQGILDLSRMERYAEIRRIRNSIVHGPAKAVPIERIQYCLIGMRDLLSFLEAGSYIEFLRELSETELRDEIESRIADTRDEIVGSSQFSGATTETNATGFSIDDYEIENIDLDQNQCVAKIVFSATGEQIEDMVYHGSRITGGADAVFDADGGIEYSNITAEVDHDDPADDAGVDD